MIIIIELDLSIYRYISLVSPKDEILKGKWLKAIPRDNWFPSQYSVVCNIHFPENNIITEETLYYIYIIIKL